MIGKTGLTLLVIAVLLGSLSCRKEPTKTSRAPSGAPRQGQPSQAPPTKVGGEQGPTAQQPGTTAQQPGTTAPQPGTTAQQPPAGTKQAPGAEPNQAGTARGQTSSGQVTPTATKK